MLRHGLITAVFNCLIATLLTITGGDNWVAHMVYSMSIGIVAWLFIDGGRLLISGHRESLWPEWPWGMLLIAAGVAVGFFVGNLIGDAWVGAPTFDFLELKGHKLATGITITIIAAIGMSFFFYSLGKSKHLQGQIELAQRNATEARLKLLETQLEPHMLFNTLANLRVLITVDPPRAVAMLDRLNSYLRMTLSGSRALSHPLSAEFERLGDYLELMSVRMGTRLRYTLDLPQELRDAPVPPLLLQPLVENSIRHGLEPKVEGGEIVVRARQEAGQLVIEVNDTGVGLDAAPPSEGSGFGLEQVRERLATVYGERGSMNIGPSPSGGTSTTLSFPAPA
ncbi:MULTISPECIES: histidine kinase [unclassified Variovorax]|uniref:sensor histidine kinase n=1 Tax=unclassified Variovorax TaxID=663243 RepID=UPI000F7DD1C2|nr:MULTISPECIES: histidine kinase [unclassified Variovorax]RSZ36253.1 sensor histidine kinase [Variovorax sp. 553]RSZ36876.1 sensor histidine kinase [Variovorax sp. 679]